MGVSSNVSHRGDSMTKTNNRQGFTILGFSKSGFSCCSQWYVCDYGKNGCALSEKDNEAAEHCHCYQRNNRKVTKQSTELDSLFDLIKDEDIHSVFQTIENRAFLERKKREKAEIEERCRRADAEHVKKLSTMSDYDVLLYAVKDWTRMSAHRNTIKKALTDGDKDEAFRAFKKMINESGSGGGMISYFKFYKTIEIKTRDGRCLTPSEEELWDIYFSAWEEENALSLFSFL